MRLPNSIHSQNQPILPPGSSITQFDPTTIVQKKKSILLGKRNKETTEIIKFRGTYLLCDKRISHIDVKSLVVQ